MKKITLELPAMYGDHHVQEVRRILSGIEGVSEIYASSSFRIVDITFDSKKTKKKDIEEKLEKAGYSGDLEIPSEGNIPATEGKDEKYFRHTSAYEQTRHTVSFRQNMGYEGRPLWPCPGIGPLSVNPLQVEKENKDG
jgi:copper chaperone CopZ